jgi:hypothetical protein
MTRVAVIQIDFLGWWLAGTGAGLGAAADVRACRAADGWPAIPMSQVKGTLRETAEALLEAGMIERAAFDRLFGVEAGPDETAISFDGEAVVPARLRPAGASPKHLFSRVASTAIDVLGVADDFTLRATEVVRPLRLEGSVTAHDGAPEDWIATLDLICAATLALGRDKTSFGDALVRCLPAEVPAPRDHGSDDCHDEGTPEAGKAQILEVLLHQRTDASYAALSATLGVQKTLPTPTGASLLGWCARRYGDFAEPEHVFNTGRVRFGTAFPDAGEGVAVFPIPKTLTVPKAGAGFDDDRIDPAHVRQGRALDRDDKDQAKGVQYKALGDGFMTPGLRRLSVRRVQRTRTATEDGRAKASQLFTVQHVPPHPTAAFRSEIAFDASVSPEDRRMVADALRDGPLRLGADRRSGKGGLFDTTLRWRDAPEVERHPPFDFKDTVAVLCLSDVAALDCYGMPVLVIPPKDLGLGNAVLLRDRSVLSHRRYAPWNRLFGARIEERSVIEAGSVLVYELTEKAFGVATRQCVGAYRSEGLGRVVVAPSILSGWHVQSEGEANLVHDRAHRWGEIEPCDRAGDEHWRDYIRRRVVPKETIDG